MAAAGVNGGQLSSAERRIRRPSQNLFFVRPGLEFYRPLAISRSLKRAYLETRFLEVIFDTVDHGKRVALNLAK